jgi:CRP/FNR family cyclic AMP-dependent transcriptional regulator
MLRTLLSAYPFQDVSAEELTPLLPSFRRHHFKAGEFVWRQGDDATDLWFVLDGQLHSVYASADGTEVVTQVAGTGESFGQPALFAPVAKRIVSVVAIVPADLASLPRDALLRFVEAHPPALRRLLESMSVLVLSQSHLFSQVAFHDVRGRVAYQLLKLADEYGEAVDDGQRIPFRFSQATLAGLVASSRESTNRALNAFVTSGDIKQHEGHIIVIQREGLRRALGRSS